MDKFLTFIVIICTTKWNIDNLSTDKNEESILITDFAVLFINPTTDLCRNSSRKRLTVVLRDCYAPENAEIFLETRGADKDLRIMSDQLKETHRIIIDKIK